MLSRAPTILRAAAGVVLVLAGCIAPTPATEFEPGGASSTSTLPEPTVSATISPIPPSLATGTVIATLPAEDANRLLSQFLRSNTGCQLPCWWGVTPGNSTPVDAYSQWRPLSAAAKYADLSRTGDGHIWFQRGLDDLATFLDVAYSADPNKGVINGITVGTQALRKNQGGYEEVYDAQAYQDLLRAYMLPQLLTTYGSPAQVILEMDITNAEPTSPNYFLIWLLYPERGAIIRYTMPAKVVNGTVHGCPTNSFVDLWLLPAGDDQSYQKALYELTGSHWQGTTSTSSYFKPIKEAAGMTLEQFYQRYKERTESCLETPLSIWPAH